MKTRFLAALLTSSCFFVVASPARSQCVPTSTQQTIWGGNQRIVIEQAKPVKMIHGIARGPAGGALEGVLVEVFDHPEIVKSYTRQQNSAQTRMAACMTNESGRFSFELPPGDYELRLSKSSEWDVMSVIVRVRKSARSSTKTTADLELGT